MKILSTILLFTIVCTTVSALEIIETRMSVDPALRGIWESIGGSSDGGKTWEFNVEEVARVRATTITIVGESFEVENVIVFRDNRGEIGNIINFTNNTSRFVITNVTTIDDAFMIQLFIKENGEHIEFHRVIFTVVR